MKAISDYQALMATTRRIYVIFAGKFCGMFDFFSRKKFLVDYLEGFVDVHNHILPGIDDGAATIEDSIGLVRGFGEFGLTKFVATPHIMHNVYPNTPETINEALDKLRSALMDNGIRDVSMEAAAEHMIDDNFETILERGEIMKLKKEHILVEMSFLQAPINFDQAIGKITSKWMFPVLAHPERYKFLHHRMRKYAGFREQGVLLQLNLLSLCDYYDKDVQKMALKLLDERLINFVASDVHRLEHLEILKETTLPDKVFRQLIPVIHKTIETFY